ncbi:MAG TPA: glycosyltransferase family 87 protein [Vicinamibacterales bacterium]|nr:glycosyltransferase family 87 protein [Vicinamibacterales bacterium]
MLEALDRFRIFFGARPLFLTLAVLALLVIVGRVSGRLGGRSPFPASQLRWSRFATQAIGIAGAIGLLAYAATMVWYAAEPHFFDYAEPSLIAIGWLFHLGQPLYHLPDSPERYSHIYGPIAFMVHGYALGAFGAAILVSKAISAAAAAGGMLCTFAALRRHARAPWALALCGVVALVLMAFKNFSYWTRPEPFQLLAVGASLLLAARGRGVVAAAGVGLASGVLWNLKITGPLYSLPVFVLLYERSGWRACATAFAVGVSTAALPFLLFANVSLTNYLYWFGLSANTGLLLSTLKQNLEWAVYFGLPVLISYYAVLADKRVAGGSWRWLVIALVIGVAGLTIAAAKPGAGPYHLMPFLPVIAYVVAWQTSGFTSGDPIDPLAPRAAIAFVAAACVIALAQQANFVTIMSERRARHESEDIARFARSHDGIVEMAYGASEALSLERPLLVFRNNAYLIDQPAVREHQLAGVEVPRATIDAIGRCRVHYWLVPKGEAPFAGRNFYAAVFLKPLFPDDLRRTFLERHTRVGETAYFDVWQCRPASAP